MNQSAFYRSLKRELDQAEVDVPVKKLRLNPIVPHRLVCRFLASPKPQLVIVRNSPVNEPSVAVPDSPVNKPPVAVRNSPVNKPSVAVPDSPVNKPPVAVRNSPVNKPSVAVPDSPVNKLPVAVPNSPFNKPSVAVPDSPVNKPPVFLQNWPPVVRNSPVSKPPVVAGASPVNKPPFAVRPFLAKEVAQLLSNGRTRTYTSRIVKGSVPILHCMSSDESASFDIRRMSETEREAEKRGYTRWEFKACRGFLFERKFEKSFQESSEPMPRRYRFYKEFLDQIRDTRGYGLTVAPGPLISDKHESETPWFWNLECILDGWEKDPMAQNYVKTMEGMVVAKIQEKMGKPYKCAGLVNLVQSNTKVRLVTFHVHEEGTETREVAEAFFRFDRPPVLENIDLKELRLRRGEQVLFSTGEPLAYNKG